MRFGSVFCRFLYYICRLNAVAAPVSSVVN